MNEEKHMKDDDKTLITALRGGGHDDVADALAGKVRAAEEPAEEPAQRPAPRTKEEADEQFLADVKSRINDPWTSTGLF